MKFSDLNITPDLSGDGYFLVNRNTTQKKATVDSVDELLENDALGGVGGSSSGGGSAASPVTPLPYGGGGSGGLYTGVLCGGVDTLYLPSDPEVGDKIIIFNICEPPFAIDDNGKTVANSDGFGAYMPSYGPPSKTTLIYIGSDTWHMFFEIAP